VPGSLESIERFRAKHEVPKGERTPPQEEVRQRVRRAYDMGAALNLPRAGAATGPW
jgi:hypothetical protein